MASNLHLFAEDAGRQAENPNQPPNCISAKALDSNFKACSPVDNTGNNSPYRVISDKDGWRLEPVLEFDVCENGQPRKFRFFAQRVGQ